MKKALFLYGSRNKKNSYALAQLLKNKLSADYEFSEVFAHKLKMQPCIGCDFCKTNDRCIYDDDMSVVYDLLEQASLIVLVTPVYFNSVTGALKNLIDRTQINYNRFRKNADCVVFKKGVVLSTAGAPLSATRFTGVKLVADYFFRSHFAKYVGSLCISSADSQPISEREELNEAVLRLVEALEEDSCVDIEL